MADRHQPLIAWMSVLSCIVAALAAFMAVYLPIHLNNAKSVADLVAARNLAYIAERLAEETLIKAKNRQNPDEVASDKYDFASSMTALDAVSFTDIIPQSITPYFVDIYYVVNAAKSVRDSPAKYSDDKIDLLVNRSRNDMSTIDAYLNELNIPFINDCTWGDRGVMYYTKKDMVISFLSYVFDDYVYFKPSPKCGKAGQ